jgi:hypothetical protein
MVLEKDKEKQIKQDVISMVNGARDSSSSSSSIVHKDTVVSKMEPQMDASSGRVTVENAGSNNGGEYAGLLNGIQPNVTGLDIVKLMDELNDQIIAGSNELLKNMTDIVEDKLSVISTNSNNSNNNTTSSELTMLLLNMTRDVQTAQQKEIQRQMDEIERLLVRPFEDFAFNDAALLQPASKNDATVDTVWTEEERRRKLEEHRRELVIAGANSTLAESSRRMRTAEIIRNLNVAPLYYSITLFLRWFRKVSAPPLAMLAVLKGAGSLVAGKTKKAQAYSDFIRDGEAMQAGWKRTGEIAAKGKLARKWAILRRSAEIWGYFSSFYIKERRMTKMYESGRWSEEKFSEERSKLGAEITQNLLKLGPTFIKVRTSEINWRECFYGYVPVALKYFVCCHRLANCSRQELILFQRNTLNSSKISKTTYLHFLEI